MTLHLNYVGVVVTLSSVIIFKCIETVAVLVSAESCEIDVILSKPLVS